jgi:hypothetical protein
MRGFFTMQGSTIHPHIHYCGWVVQNFIFFQFDPQIFISSDLVLIEDQLILIFYEKMGLNKERPK